MFDRHTNKALNESGYNYRIKHTPQLDQSPIKKRRERYPDIFWFKPPFIMAVVTRVGEAILKLIDKHFSKGSPYYKYCYRRTVTVSSSG